MPTNPDEEASIPANGIGGKHPGPTPVVSEYRLRRRVQFHETDSAGIVHFSWFYRYMEEAEHALWRKAGLSILEPVPEVGFPRVAASFEFKRPLRFEDVFDLYMTIREIRAKTIRYAAVITLDDTIIATGSLTAACVRRIPGQPMRAIPIPASITDRLEPAAADFQSPA